MPPHFLAKKCKAGCGFKPALAGLKRQKKVGQVQEGTAFGWPLKPDIGGDKGP